MRRLLSRGVLLLALAVGLGGSPAVAGAEQAPPAGVELPAKLPKLKGPVIVTSCGQSPGSVMIKLLCKKNGIDCTQDDLITAGQLKGYKTLAVTMGTSLKGMGAAGVDIEAETKRVGDLIAAAHKQGIFVIGAQIEGKNRRTDQTDEASNKAVAPVSDLLVIMKEVNYDGYFSNVAKQKSIPIIFIQKNLDFGYVAQVLFGAN